MKKIKKLMALLIAAAMVMGMSLTTFAAGETATITVEDLDAGATAKYLQVVEPDTESVIGWKFVNEAYASAFSTAFDVDDADAALKALIALKGDTNAADGTIHSSTELGAALTALSGTVTESGTAMINATATVPTAGLYVIVATTDDASYSYIPMMAYVADEGEGNLVDATVTAKGSHNTIDKNVTDDNDHSVSEGDTVEFRATVKYPFYSPDAAEKTFYITDTLTNGTFVEESVKVTIGGAEVQATPVFGNDTETGKPTMTIDFEYDAEFAGQDVVVTYSAVVGAGEENVVNNITTNLDSTGDSVTLAKVSVKVLKTGKENKVLPGAKFEIYEAGTAEDRGYVKYENVSVYGNEDPETLYLRALGEAVTAGEDGSLTFSGLDADKTYYVKEVEAPAGYTVNPNYYPVGTTTPNENESADDTFVYNDFEDITVTDDNLSALPSTGGIGTTIFTIGGCVIMIVAAGLFFASRKRR